VVTRDSEVIIRGCGCLFACLILLLARIPMQVQIARPAPIWIADLSAFSYASRPNPHNIGGKPYIGGKAADIGIVFPNSNETICYFVAENQNVQLGHRGELEESAPFSLELVAFDLKTGTLRFRRELPARPRFTTVAVNSDGNLLIRSGDTLRLYSSEFKVLKERPLETKDYDRWITQVSLSGRTLLLEHYSPFDTYDEILNSASFASLFSFKVDWFPVSSISDKALLKASPDSNQIVTRDFGGPWQEIPLRSLVSCVSSPVLINDSEVLSACGQQVTLMSRSGQILMKDTIEKKEHLEPLTSVTPNGRLAAVSAQQIKGGFLDTPMKRNNTRILIYDTELRTQVFSVLVEPIPRRDYDFGLAPGGDRLVVMTDGVVKTFAIPPLKDPRENLK
jgi:hypothetical protein